MVGGRVLRLIGIGAALAACGTVQPGSSAPPPVPYGVVARPEQRSYPVNGLTEREILRSLRENGPVARGRPAWGLHEWSVRWTYRFAPAGGVCRMQDVRVELRSVTTMPRWVDRERADSVLIRDWDAMLAALRTHENGHRDISYRAAREVQRALERVSAPSCGLIPARANARGQEVLRRYHDRNRRYDEETQRGRTQGVAWPPQRGEASRREGAGA